MTERRAAARKTQQKRPKKIDDSFYLGYVEEGESIEMIMKKFQTLEELQTKQAATTNIEIGETPEVSPALTEENLKELFKQTSTFTVDMVMDEQKQGFSTFDFAETFDTADVEGYFSDEEHGFFGEEEDFFDSDDQDERKKKRKGILGGKKPDKDKARIIEVTGADGYVYTVKKRVRQIDPNEPSFVKIPPLPVPISWAKMIKPYVKSPPTPPGSNNMEIDILTELPKQVNITDYLGVLIDPPWKVGNKTGKGYIDARDLEKLPLKSITAGYVFLWVEKEVISEAIKLMDHKFNFTYVENLVWAKQTAFNHLEMQDSAYLKKSKITLLIFKKGDGIELRHQRNPDVVFDFIKEDKALTEDKPEFVYHVIETLLPTANYNAETGKGKLLELWAKSGNKRKGWVTVSQKLSKK